MRVVSNITIKNLLNIAIFYYQNPDISFHLSRNIHKDLL